MNLEHSFYVKPAGHEMVETTVSLSLDRRPALLGAVVGADEKPVPDALVAFYRADAPDRPVGALYTDEFGRFAFGPLEPGQLYQVKICKPGGAFRALE